MAALDREIAAEEERLLDAWFGPAEPDPLPEPPAEPPSPAEPPMMAQSPPPNREPPEPAIGLTDRFKRAITAFLGRWTDQAVPGEPENIRAGETVSDGATVPDAGAGAPSGADPIGAVVPAGIITLGSQWPEPSSPSGPAVSGAGEGAALAAFFREPPVLVDPQPAAPLVIARGIDLPAEWSTLSAHVEVADPPQASPLNVISPVVSPPADVDDLMLVHNEAISQARADLDVVQAEEAGGGRFDRLRGWWTNMREHFVEWRDHLQERFHEQVESIRTRWDTPEPAAAPRPPGPEQSHPEPPMEPEP